MKTILKIILGLLLAGSIIFLINKYYDTPAPSETVDTPADAEVNPITPQEGLPTAVEEKRQQIAAAAKAKDYEKLESLTAAENFSYSFGGPYEGGFAEYLKLENQNTGRDVLDRMYLILSQPYTKISDIYAWPAVFAKEAKDWTAEDMAMLEALSTPEEIEMYRKFGSYIGYRLGIREDGTWIYFIAGD